MSVLVHILTVIKKHWDEATRKNDYMTLMMQKVVMTSAGRSQETDSHINFGVMKPTLGYVTKSFKALEKSTSPSRRCHPLKFIMKQPG